MGQKIFFRNGKPYLAFQDNTPYLYVSGSITPQPIFSGVPLSPSGFRLSSFSSFGINRAADPICAGVGADSQLRITFSWDINDQANDPLDFYAIRRVPTEFIGVDDTATGIKDGFNGQYGLKISGIVSGALDMVTNFEPFNVSSLLGTGTGVVATTTYDSNDSFYQYGFDSSNTPKYTNGLGIESIEFSATASPKITFRNSEEKNRFTTFDGGADGISMMLYGATGSMSNYSFAYDGTSDSKIWHLKNDNIVAEDSTSITYSGEIGTANALSDLLSDLETRGTDNQWLYIQLTTDDIFTGKDFTQRCVTPNNLPSPLILRRIDLTPISNKYEIEGIDYDCDHFGFQMLAVNPSGQSIPTYTGIEDVTAETYSWTIKEATDANIYDSGGVDFGVQYGGSNGFDGYFVVPTGYTYYMLSASGFLYDYLGGLITTASSSNPGGTGGKLNFSKPSQGWYYAEAEEQWRITGPSGESSPIIRSIRCGDNFTYVV